MFSACQFDLQSDFGACWLSSHASALSKSTPYGPLCLTQSWGAEPVPGLNCPWSPQTSIEGGHSTNCLHLLILFVCYAEFLSSTDLANEDLHLGPGLHFLLSLHFALCS